MTPTTVDVHAHWWPPEALDHLDRAAAGNPAPNLPAPAFVRAPDIADLARRLELMDAAGIDVEVLSNPTQPDAARHPELARITNDGLAAACAERPERFRFYASLPLPDADASVDELERMAGAEACDGVLVPTHVQGASLDDAAFEPLLRALDDRAATVALHPDFFRAPGVLSEWFMDWTIGAPFEDTIAAMRLLSSGRAEQFPRIRWIVPHAGGTLPLMWQRLDNQYEYNRDMIGLDRPPSTYARRFLYDTANQSPATLALAVSEQGADRLLFGTDYPFIGRHDMGYAVRALRECPALGDAEVDAILARGASPP